LKTRALCWRGDDEFRAELLLAKLNLALAESSNVPAASARVASSVELASEVVVAADALELAAEVDGAVLARLRLINAGRLNFIAAPEDNSSEDVDNDGVADTWDNCRVTSNAGQADVDSDGVGDACEVYPVAVCRYDDVDGSYAAFGFVNAGRERRFRQGINNEVTGGAAEGLPHHFPRGSSQVAFVPRCSRRRRAGL
jgi:hypothetical protein